MAKPVPVFTPDKAEAVAEYVDRLKREAAYDEGEQRKPIVRVAKSIIFKNVYPFAAPGYAPLYGSMQPGTNLPDGSEWYFALERFNPEPSVSTAKTEKWGQFAISGPEQVRANEWGVLQTGPYYIARIRSEQGEIVEGDFVSPTYATPFGDFLYHHVDAGERPFASINWGFGDGGGGEYTFLGYVNTTTPEGERLGVIVENMQPIGMFTGFVTAWRTQGDAPGRSEGKKMITVKSLSGLLGFEFATDYKDRTILNYTKQSAGNGEATPFFATSHTGRWWIDTSDEGNNEGFNEGFRFDGFR